jgi:methionyl-tRNA formyltransferase
MKKYPRLIFFGTPEFAVASLEALTNAEYNIVGVVTAPDRQAGRGMKLISSPVKRFALKHDLLLLQPDNLKDPSFLRQLEVLQPDLQVVVAFRLLPEKVWSMPPLGTFNLHASILPQYRGAAPINWVIINGEEETGVTTFFLDDKIDTGKIIFQRKTFIGELETAGELHDRLMKTGAELVLETVRAIEDQNVTLISQDLLMPTEQIIRKAPKINKEDCTIDWQDNVINIFNLIRGMSPHPGASTVLNSKDGTSFFLKVYKALPEFLPHSADPGQVLTDGRSYLKVASKDGFIQLTEIQPAARKPMSIADFLRGFGRHFT